MLTVIRQRSTYKHCLMFSERSRNILLSFHGLSPKEILLHLQKKTILIPGRETSFANFTSNIVFDRKLRIFGICGSLEDEEVVLVSKKKTPDAKKVVNKSL